MIHKPLSVSDIKQMIIRLNEGLDIETAPMATMIAILATCRRLCDLCLLIHGVDILKWTHETLGGPAASQADTYDTEPDGDDGKGLN